MAITAEMRTSVLELYTAYFNRAADKDGVDYWLNEMDTNGWTIDQVAQSFADQTEYTTIYGSMTNAEIVTAVYTNVLNRDADADGAAYWEADLDAGNITVKDLVNAVVQAAKENGGDDAAIVANKTAVSEFAYDLGRNETDTSLSSITADAATVTTETDAIQAVYDAEVAKAEQEAKDAETVGSTLTLTTQIDTIAGTDKNDTIVGDNSTASTSDQIAGGSGTDTVKLYDISAQTKIPTMTSVENLELINATASLDVSETGATNITAQNLTTAKIITIAADQDVTFSTLAGGETQKVTTTATDTAVNLTLDKVGTKAAAHTLVDVIGAKVDTLNVTATGTDSYLTGLTASTGALKNLVVSGDAKLSVTTALVATATNVDASAMTDGGLTVEVDKAVKTVTGGAGADKIIMNNDSTAAKLTVDLGAGNDTFDGDTGGAGDQDFTDTTTTIDGGEGVDTIVVADTETADFNKAKNNNMAEVTNFETIKVIGADTDFDMDFITAATGATDVTTVDAAAIAISDMASGSTLTVDGTATNATNVTTVTVKNAGNAGSTDDVLNIKLANTGDDAAPLAVVTVADVETINIETVEETATAVVGDVHLMRLVANDALTINVTGDEAIDLDEATTSFSAVKTFDASGLTGNLTVSLASANQGVTFTGTSKVDTVTTSGNVDSITLGDGADIIAAISAGAKVQDFTFGTGGDILDLSGAGNSANGGFAASDTDGTIKIIAEDSTKAQVLGDNDIFAISVAKKADYDTATEIKTLFGAGVEFEDIGNTEEGTLLIHAADTNEVYVYDITEVGSNGIATGADTITLVGTFQNVELSALDAAVAANFQA